MDHELRVFDDADMLSRAAAALVAERARRAVRREGTFSFAVSGGRTPWAMFATLTRLAVPWDRTVIWQVDERVAPADDPERNLAHLREALGAEAASAEVRPMPVDDDDLDAAAARYADALPARFHLVHLGLGSDGHTASLVPTDSVLDVSDRPVAVTGNAYGGRRRMTLTYSGLRRAEELLWLVSGEDKRGSLAKLLGQDTSIPAGRVEAGASTVMADRAATG